MFELDINKIKEQSMQFVDTAYKAAMDIADKGKNQLDLASQQNRLAKAQRQLGALVYSLHKADEENQPLVDKYIENIAEIEKAIEEIKARMTPDEAAAAEAAEAEQEAEDPNDPTTYHDDPAGLTPEEEQALADAYAAGKDGVDECLTMTGGTIRLFAADTLADLADHLGLTGEKKDNFLASVKNYNAKCAAGYDDDYGKDPSVLFAVQKAPYYAFSKDIYAGYEFLCTTGGLWTDNNQNVYDEYLDVIPGL